MVKKLVVVVVLAATGYAAVRIWGEISSRPEALQVTPVRYVVPLAGTRELPRPDRVSVVGFWITNCSYSENLLSVMNAVRYRYPERQVDVVGFHLNPTTPAELQAYRVRNGYRFTLVPAQPPIQLVAKLDSTYGFRLPGRDVYVVHPSGRALKVDVSGRDSMAKQVARVSEAIDQIMRT